MTKDDILTKSWESREREKWWKHEKSPFYLSIYFKKISQDEKTTKYKK